MEGCTSHPGVRDGLPVACQMQTGKQHIATLFVSPLTPYFLFFFSPTNTHAQYRKARKGHCMQLETQALPTSPWEATHAFYYLPVYFQVAFPQPCHSAEF